MRGSAGLIWELSPGLASLGCWEAVGRVRFWSNEAERHPSCQMGLDSSLNVGKYRPGIGQGLKTEKQGGFSMTICFFFIPPLPAPPPGPEAQEVHEDVEGHAASPAGGPFLASSPGSCDLLGWVESHVFCW